MAPSAILSHILDNQMAKATMLQSGSKEGWKHAKTDPLLRVVVSVAPEAP